MLPAYHQKIKQQGLWRLDFGSSFGGSRRTDARVKRGGGETLFQNHQKRSFLREATTARAPLQALHLFAFHTPPLPMEGLKLVQIRTASHC